jgi:hypothetical protein
MDGPDWVALIPLLVAFGVLGTLLLHQCVSLIWRYVARMGHQPLGEAAL